MIVASLKIAGNAQGLFETPANSISFDSVANSTGRREADSGGGRRCGFLAPSCLQGEGLAAPARPGRGALEISALLQSREPRRAAVPALSIFGAALAHGTPSAQQDRQGAAPRRLELGGEPLAPAGAARRYDPAAADRRHARPKPVPTLAYKLARLIGPLHFLNSPTVVGGAGAPMSTARLSRPSFKPRAQEIPAAGFAARGLIGAGPSPSQPTRVMSGHPFGESAAAGVW